MDRKGQEKNKRKGGLVFGIAAAVIIVAMAGVIIYLLLSRDSEPEKEERNIVVTPENVERVLEELETQEYTPPGYYTVTMETTWHFATGEDASYDAVVWNVEKNTNDVCFDIVLKDDESEVLYESPIIPRGSYLEEITLDKVMEAGTYDCVMIYHLVDDEQNTVSNLRVAMQIIVEG